MPISFGTSTTVISLPALSGGLVGCPPSYFIGAGAGGAPIPHSSGLVGRSSPPSHLAAAFAPVAQTDSANAAAAVVTRYLDVIVMFPSLLRRPCAANSLTIRHSLRRWSELAISTDRM